MAASTIAVSWCGSMIPVVRAWRTASRMAWDWPAGPRLSAWSVRWPVNVILAMRSRRAGISRLSRWLPVGEVVESDADRQVAAVQHHGAGAHTRPTTPAGHPDRAGTQHGGQGLIGVIRVVETAISVISQGT
jgi:hypothetical protein